MSKNYYSINSIAPLRDTIFGTNLEEGDRVTKGGIIIYNDNMENRGVRARWSQAYSVGPDADVKVGQWCLVEHGRWSMRISLNVAGEDVDVWQIEPKSIMMVCDEDPRGTIVPYPGKN